MPAFAEGVAKDDIGAELTKRFRILQTAAAEPALVSHLEKFRPDEARKQLSDHALQQWIEGHRLDNIDRAETDSWFLNDRSGLQIARHPLIDDKTMAAVDSFLNSYAYRNYFHGEKRDRPKQDATDVKPITQPNLSAVYLSSTTNQLKVALSVPVWSQPQDGEEPVVLAVLSMSVGLEAFDVLSPKKKQGKDIIIADLRDDYLETDPTNLAQKLERRGMILQHPQRSSWKDEDQVPRLAAEVLAATDAMSHGFVSGYHDPLSRDPNAKFWGAFEPVRYEIVNAQNGTRSTVESGWVVLLQLQSIE